MKRNRHNSCLPAVIVIIAVMIAGGWSSADEYLICDQVNAGAAGEVLEEFSEEESVLHSVHPGFGSLVSVTASFDIYSSWQLEIPAVLAPRHWDGMIPLRI